jgi:two-component system, chemotaxis family, CheB/CheR fusion protein
LSVDESPAEGGRDRADDSSVDFVRLLDYLKAARGFDFASYKLSSLVRRMRKRIQQLGIGSYTDYIDFLEVHPEEFNALFNTVLINVTGFFRDPEAWAAVAERVLPRILEAKGGDEPLRCWSAGCASGEEAYTLAMLLAEAIGFQELRRRVKIYATDIDEEALAYARLGTFTAAQTAGIPPELLAKYFEPQGDRFLFRADLRRSLIFGRHDLLQDAAISRLDLLVCRNTLMYFNAEAQAKILARFHFALQRHGFLFLGRAETLLSHNNGFRPEDLKVRLFQRTANASLRDRLLALTPALPSALDGLPLESGKPGRLREAVFDRALVAQIAVDRKGRLLLANEKARQLFQLAPADLGRPLRDLEISYRPVELRSHIEAAGLSRQGVTLQQIEWRPNGGETRMLEVQVLPLAEDGGAPLGVSVSFLDLTLQHQLRRELERATQELETASEELQSANEELETTNEELQSTIEELETTNEELQSANEELETMNAELQSTNEELRSMNDQIQQRSDELRQVNTYLQAILGGLRAAVVVLDADLRVAVWSDKAQDLWGLRGDEVQGEPFLSLDIGLPVGKLAQPVRACLDGGPQGVTLALDGINRRGRTIHCQVTCTRLVDGPQPAAGVILLMEEAPRGAPQAGNLQGGSRMKEG